MLYFIQQTYLPTNEVSCVARDFNSRESFTRALQGWNQRNGHSHCFKEIPSSCVRRLFPGAKWKDCVLRSWPKNVQELERIGWV